ncbi:MAG: type II toxin-antitoxin system VapC family toxin [Acidobacteriota bacterium]
MEDPSQVLVDTSVWIEFFRRRDPHFSAVSRLVNDGAVSVIPLIVAELIQGARSRKEIHELKELLAVFPLLEESPDSWIQAGELAFQLKGKGLHPGLADCFITVLGTRHSVRLFTLDKHFQQIRLKTQLSIYQAPSN